MGSHLIIEGNAVYEVDEACIRNQEKKKKEQQSGNALKNRKKNGKRKIPR